MEPVDRIKLMMSYDNSKTLNENLDKFPTLNENENQIDEQPAGLSRKLRAGATEAEMISKFAKSFGMSDDVVKLALAKDLTTLEKDIQSAIRKDAKSGVKVGSTNTLGPAAKEASKAKAIKEIMSKGANITDKEIIDIIERTKNSSKSTARKIEGSIEKRIANAEKKVTPVGEPIQVKGPNGELITVSSKQDATTIIQQTNIQNVTKDAAVDGTVMVRTSKEVVPEAKVIAAESEQVVKEMGPSKWEKFKRIAKRLKPKYLIMLGLLGITGWGLYKFFSGDSPKPKKDLFPSCLDDIIDDDGTSIQVTTGGDPVVKVTKTGNANYDSKGGLMFYNNNRVFLGNNTKRGTWSCSGGGVELSEQGDGNKNTGIGGITIKWDGDSKVTPIKSDDGNKVTPKQPVSPKYHDCSSKDFPFEFGCISPKIAEVQGCLGVTPQKGYLGPKTYKALTDYHYETKDGLTKEMYDKILSVCKPPKTEPVSGTTGNTVTGTTATITGTTETAPNAPITPPKTPENPVFDTKRLKELNASKNLMKSRGGKIVKWKGPELSGEDYFILNKYLTDNGYIQKTQRETGDRDDEDVTMKYKWKKVEEPTTEV